MNRRPRKTYLIAAAALSIVMVASGLGEATTLTEWTGADKAPNQERAQVPEDRFAMAGGCYAARTTDGGYVVRDADGFAATGTSLEGAEPFHFQATDLGSYLLFGSADDYLAASEGALAEAAYTVTRSTPGAMAGGVAMERTDAGADDLARSDANREAGRGASVIAAATPSELADWVVSQTTEGAFSFELPATEQVLTVGGAGALELADADATAFELEQTGGCAAFPEVEVNVTGPVMGGETSFQEVRGFMDLHLHALAFEFLGGRVRCGRPWSRFGVAHALVDCPDHEPNGEGAVLEQVLSGSPGGHDPDGWPSFEGWPRYDYLTHEQVYYKWLERAWRGGLRMLTALLVDNSQLCQAYPYKRNSCNEMDGVRLQETRVRELEAYIDAQSGGPGEGWFRIVDDPFEARQVMNDGKLAIVLGIEVSVLLDCGLKDGVPQCTESQIDTRLQEVYDMGVRQMELVNKFDNALSGVTGDAGPTGIVVNFGNYRETGRYWQMDTCPEDAGDATDKAQMNPDDAGLPDQFTGRDSMVAGILSQAGRTGATPLYPPAPHCNVLGLSPLGEHLIRGMVDKGMIFDPDHMSASARTSAMDLLDSLDYSGVASSHSWADDTIYPRVYERGGVVTPSDSSVGGFVDKYEDHKDWADDRFLFGFGYGSDINGFSSSASPTNGNPTVVYPYTGFGGATIEQQVSGSRTYDINADGVAHYGLYTDWIQGLRISGGEQMYEDMTLGPEAYLQMWERALGVPGDACRDDVDDLIGASFDDALTPGMSYLEVLWALGQPSGRLGSTFTYCTSDRGEATLTFTPEGALSGWTFAG